MITLLAIKLADDTIERVRRNLHAAIDELQRLPAARAVFIKNVELGDGVTTPIAHSLGRPVFVKHSPVRGAVSAGFIEELRDGQHDRSRFIVLRANDYGATVTVDLEVMPL